MLHYFIFAATCILVLALFFFILQLRWKQRLNDLKNIFKELDLPEIDMDHRIPFH